MYYGKGVVFMKKTGKIILSTLLIASISLTAMPAAMMNGSPTFMTKVSAAETAGTTETGVKSSYNATTDTLTFTGEGMVNAAVFTAARGDKTSIDTVILSDGITGIEDVGRIKIRRIVLGKDVKLCEAYVTSEYRLDAQNTNFSVYDTALYTSDLKTLLRVPTQKTNLTYPDGLTTIGSYAFYGNEANIIVVPWGVTTIQECGLVSQGYIKIIPDTVTRFDTLEGYRSQSGSYLWEGDNAVIQAAAAVYSSNDRKDFDTALSAYWQQFGYQSITDTCKGINGSKITGWYTISGIRFYFSSNGQPTTGWQQIDGKWYHFSSTGIPDTGSNMISESYSESLGQDLTYYFDGNGALQTNTSFQQNGTTYYVNSMGVVSTTPSSSTSTSTSNQNGLVTENGNTYYYVNGVKQTGLHYINDKAYIFDSNGVMQKSGWYQAEGDWYYLNDYGAGAVKCWRLKDGKYVNLGADGKMQTNCWILYYNDWYYVKADGTRYESSWAKIGASWYWFGGSGKMMSNGWLKLDGKWYYFRSGGQMATGWVKDGNKWYYLTGSGAMAANKWVKSGSYWYYLGSSGAMLTNTTTPDGYYVDSEGRWV